jgi:hypothetical protein
MSNPVYPPPFSILKSNPLVFRTNLTHSNTFHTNFADIFPVGQPES